jgi:DNA-binding response OmpR family regulator
MDTEINILIVEDNPSDSALIHRELKKAGIAYSSWVVETKNNYEKALENNKIDIILSDYSLPSFDAESAFAIRQQKYSDLPFIIVSGIFGEEKAVELIKNGVTDYVAKENLFSLVPKINRALNEAEDKRIKIITDKKLRIRTAHLVIANKELSNQNKEKDKKALELIGINKELSQLTESLRLANRYQAEYTEDLEKMMFITSHRVRQPVTNIIGLANMLNSAKASPEKLTKIVKMLKDSALNLDVFTRELSVFLESQTIRNKRQNGNSSNVPTMENLVASNPFSKAL